MALRVRMVRPCDHVGMSQKVNHEQDKGRLAKGFCSLERASLPTYRLRELRASESSCV